MEKRIHYPVLYREILDILKSNFHTNNEFFFIDGTCGEGGHTLKIIESFPNSRSLCIDRDEEILFKARTLLQDFHNITWKVKNFSELSIEDLKEINCENGVDCILLDLGISMYHLKESGRGFSFKGNESLDMRLNCSLETRSNSAYDIVNYYPAKELERIFIEYGEERWTKKIVEKIIERRKTNPIRTNTELAKLVESTIPRKFWPPSSHPSTRIFQAIRMEVNQELYHLSHSLTILPKLLRKNGLLMVISFHSLEDRIVKHKFRDYCQMEEYQILTKKPILPNKDEIKENRASRSAKLRVLQKLI